MRALFLLVGACSLVGSACDDLKDFRGSYQGEIVEGNFVRSCFGPRTQAFLRFDPDKAVAPLGALPPAEMNTLRTDDGTFADTVLEPIDHLPHDQLSQLDFPGPQRLRNFMLLARPDSGPLSGRDALVVISLLASESVELRVIARSADGATFCPGKPEASGAGDAGDAGDASEPITNGRYEYFGLWRLKR